MPLSVATMNSVASISRAALRMALVEPTASARAITSAGLSGCTSTLAWGWSFFNSSNSSALNSSCTMQAPFQNTMSAPVSRWMYAPRWRSGAQRIFCPAAFKAPTMSSAQLDVTSQSARALTAALVLA